jgi:U3 small nucleolar RNA-associated protein 19
VWSVVIRWEHSSAIHQQLLVVLLERILPHLDKPLLLTDYLMDSLDMGKQFVKIDIFILLPPPGFFK